MSSLGQQVILPCKAPGNMVVLAMQWSRRGLEEYVLHYRDDQLDPDGQDPSYMGRCIAFQKRPGMGRVVLSIINLNVSQSDEGSRDEVSSGAATGRNHLDLIVSLSVMAGIILVVGILYIRLF
ncbi:unnamed protein product [Oreochromis niloticus]|nr:unnamed protein product [Mustela putorius furo]